MIRTSLTVLLAGASLVVAASAGVAHHSQSAEFDRDRTIEFTGTVKTVGWTNPHGYVQVEVEGTDGSISIYKVEISAPNGLYRAGWRRTSVEPGTVVTFSGNPSRSPDSMNVSGEMTLPDGTVAYRGVGPQN
jgi:hypothetical protein